MLEHNVKIIDNCDEHINYVNSTYGPELLKNCKRVKRSRKRTKVEVGKYDHKRSKRLSK